MDQIYCNGKTHTCKIVALISHAELTSEKDGNEQKHVLVTQLLPDGAGLYAEVRFPHVGNVRAVASYHVLRLG